MTAGGAEPDGLAALVGQHQLALLAGRRRDGDGDGDAESDGVGVGASMPSTGWKVSCAVRPITSAASRGSCTPGSSTMIRRSPERVRVGLGDAQRVDPAAQHLDGAVGGLAVRP